MRYIAKKSLTRTILTGLLAAGLFLLPVAGAQAAESPATPPPEGLTLAEAVEKAVTYSKSYQQAKYDVDRAWEVRDDSKDLLKFAPVQTTDPVIAGALTKLMTADLNWLAAKKGLEVQRDAIEIETVQCYNNVLRAVEKVRAAEKGLQAAEWNRRAARVGYQVGTVSRSAVTTAEAAYAETAGNLAASRQSATDAYVKFNLLLGLTPDARPVLTDRPEYSPIEETELDFQVAKAIDNSPALVQAEYRRDLAKQVKEAARPYETGQIDVNKAELSIGQVKEGTDKAVRSLYYALTSQEELYPGYTESLRNARQAWQDAQIRFDVGVITRCDLAAAESGLARAEANLFDLVCQHESMKKSYEKPWAAR